MSDNGFYQGFLEYSLASGVTPAKVAEHLAGEWSDGFVAFANAEKRLGDLSGIKLDTDFLSDRINGRLAAGVEGYVTELNLWRSNGSYLEEIAIEREENTYFVQQIRLDMTPPERSNCYYREARTVTGSHHSRGKSHTFSGELKTVEVVWPEHRLNIYVTRRA